MKPERHGRVLKSFEEYGRWVWLSRQGALGFQIVLKVGIEGGTTLEANAALRSIVRRDTGESYEDFSIKISQASGIETPTRADLARLDRSGRRRARTTTRPIRTIPTRESRRMKDGRTHLAHEAERAVDLETGAIVGVTVQDTDDGDTTTSIETLIT